MRKSQWVFFSLCLISLGTLNIGCTSTSQIKQRGFIYSQTLVGGDLPMEAKTRPEYQKTERGVEGENYTLTVIPMTTHLMETAMLQEAKKRRMDPKKIKERFVAATPSDRQCFSLGITARREDAANLDYFHFILETPEVPSTPLFLLKPGVKPTAQNKVGSYSSGGGYIPRSTYIYNYTMYQNENFVCSKKPVDLSKGMTLYVEPRYTEGLAVKDLVWSVDPQDKLTYYYGEGRPEMSSISKVGREWSKKIDDQNRQKFQVLGE